MWLTAMTVRVDIVDTSLAPTEAVAVRVTVVSASRCLARTVNRAEPKALVVVGLGLIMSKALAGLAPRETEAPLTGMPLLVTKVASPVDSPAATWGTDRVASIAGKSATKSISWDCAVKLTFTARDMFAPAAGE